MNQRLCLSEVHKAVQTSSVDPRSPPFGDLRTIAFENVGNSTKIKHSLLMCIYFRKQKKRNGSHAQALSQTHIYLLYQSIQANIYSLVHREESQ